MENASKALIMAASVLLGIMIISVGVTLFVTFSNFSKSTESKIEEAKIAEWNDNFLKYYGTITKIENGKQVVKPVQVTMHDIISVANFAKKNNEKYELTKENSGNENTYYVQVKVNGVVINNRTKTYQNLEAETEDIKNQMLQENAINIIEINGDKQVETKYYKCKGEPLISQTTKKVYYIEFEPY